MSSPSSPLVNWAENYRFSAPNHLAPSSIEELQGAVSKAHRAKAVGTRHSFNDIADSPETMISTQNLRQVLGVDVSRKQVRIQGGVTYGQLGSVLEAQGLALPNFASLPHISVAGAIATATHGSGERNGNLATPVAEVTLVLADGSIRKCERGDPDFEGVVVGLGAFGIVAELTLDLRPTFSIRQEVFQDLPLEAVLQNFDAIQASAYSVSLFTDWTDDVINQVWLKRTMDQPHGEATLWGAKAATHDLHPIASVSAENCTPQMGVPGPWFERLAHFRAEFTPSNGAELQSEYFVPRALAQAAILALNEIRATIAPELLISEIRTVAADSLWLSSCYEREGVGFHFTWKQNWAAVRNILPVVEAALAPFHPRPHWGKLNTMSPSAIRGMYPRFDDFVALAKQTDPAGKFRNAYLTHLIEG